MSQGTKIGFTTAPGTPLSCQLERTGKEAMESVSLHQNFWQLISIFHKFLFPNQCGKKCETEACVKTRRNPRLVPPAQLEYDCWSHTKPHRNQEQGL